MNNFLNRAIDWLCLSLFFILISFPIFQILGRYINFFSIPASQEIVQHMTLWIGFIGAVIAARSNKLLSVVREPVFKSMKKVSLPQFFVHIFSLSVVFVLSVSYLKMIQIGFQYPDYIAPFIPSWFAQSIIPVGLILIWYQMILTSSSDLKYRLFVNGFFNIPTIILYFWQFPLANPLLLWSQSNFFYFISSFWTSNFYSISFIINFLFFIRAIRMGNKL